jgi:sporadic carbohydrate cluster protein (TIGR04323 family)
VKKLRGYITSTQFQGNRVPQYVQNLVIREYCAQKGYIYLLSGTEYSMSGSSLILEELINSQENIDGIVAYSLFQFPEDSLIRLSFYNKLIIQKKCLHFAIEGMVISSEADILKVEDVWRIHEAIKNTSNIIIKVK